MRQSIARNNLSKSLLAINTVEVDLIEGIHFRQAEAFFLQVVQQFCVVSWFADWKLCEVRGKRRRKGDAGQSILEVEVGVKGYFGGNSVWIQERRNTHHHQFQYFLSEEQSQLSKQADPQLTVSMKIEVQINMQKAATTKIIKMVLKQFKQSQLLKILFPFLSQHKDGHCIYKRSFCKSTRQNQMMCPENKVEYNCKEKEDAVILLVNQKHIKEVPFFKDMVQHFLQSGKRLPKIIGHPISLLLVFLVDKQHRYNQGIGEIMAGFKDLLPLKNKSSLKGMKGIQTQIKLKLQQLISKTLGQQNLLQQSFVQFFAQNLSNQELLQNFIQLVQLYYKIFLNEEVSSQQIKLALQNNFYINHQEEVFNGTNYFTTLLKSIEFKHDIYLKTVLGRVNERIDCLGRNIQEMTLKDLYEYNQVQFTFIGLDINDQIVRFFNHMTSPLLPVSAILSLCQVLPTPYKSIIWKEEWGAYKYYTGTHARLISLQNHEIVDSRFLLECPLDLLEDPKLRQCYLSNNCGKDCRIEAIVSSRIKVEDLRHVDEIKKLLKSMKNTAIDSLPKLKLIWKILTTKNRVDIDINKVETLFQIPILEKILKMNQTFKHYLHNLNAEVNSEKILQIDLPQYKQKKYDIEEMKEQVQKLIKLMNSNFGEMMSIQLPNKQRKDMNKEIRGIEEELKAIRYLNYEEGVRILSLSKNILKSYNIKHKYLYRQVIGKINRQLDRSFIINPNKIRELLIELLGKYREAEFRQDVSFRESQVRTSSHIRQTFTYIQQDNQIGAFKTIIGNLNKFLQRIYQQEHKTSISEEAMNLYFRKVIYEISLKMHRILSHKVQTQKLLQFYSKLFEISPLFYNIQQIHKHNFEHNHLITNFIKSHQENKPLHLLLSGDPSTLLEEAHHIVNMREIIDEVKGRRINTITSSGFSSVLAFLFCLNISKEEVFEEVVGIEELVRINKPRDDQKQIDIIEILSREVDLQEKLYYLGKGKRIGQIRPKLLKKYQNINTHFIQVQKLVHKANSYQLQHLYNTLQKYDTIVKDEHIFHKEKQIKRYLERQVEVLSKKERTFYLLEQNEEMLKEKIQFNKIGLKFSINFLYRQPLAAINWENIHKQQYQLLTQYKQHLYELLQKYNIDPHITLAEFNRTNYHKINLSFVFVDSSELQYSYVSGDRYRHVQLVDLLVTAVSVPVYCGAYPLQLEKGFGYEGVKDLIGKINFDLPEADKLNRFWSSQTLNPHPFNIVQSSTQEETVIALSLNPSQFSAETYPQNYPRLLTRKSEIEHEKKQLKAVDLISFWWTKPKKLTPELKEIMFGNIFESPYMKLYFFLQNSSYEHLTASFSQRSLVHLNSQFQQRIKSKILSVLLLPEGENKTAIKMEEKYDRKMEIQYIKSFKYGNVSLLVDNQQLKESSIMKIEELKKEFVFSFVNKKKEEINIDHFELGSMKIKQNCSYIIFSCENGLIKATSVSLQENELNYEELNLVFKQKVSYQYQICPECNEASVKNKNDYQNECQFCKKRNDYVLNFLISQESNETQEEIERPEIKKRGSIVKKNESWYQRFCCFNCYSS